MTKTFSVKTIDTFKNKRVSTLITIVLFIVCSLATIYFFKWALGSAQAEPVPTQEEIYTQTLETKLAQLGTDWQIHMDLSKSNLNSFKTYELLYQENISQMAKLNTEANKIRDLLGTSFTPSENLSN